MTWAGLHVQTEAETERKWTRTMRDAYSGRSTIRTCLMVTCPSPALPHAVQSVLIQVTDSSPHAQEATGASTSITPMKTVGLLTRISARRTPVQTLERVVCLFVFRYTSSFGPFLCFECDLLLDAVAYAALLRNELLGAGIETVPDPHTDDRRHAILSQDIHSLFRYTIHTKRVPFDSGNEISPYSLSPLSNKSHKLLRSPRKPARKISKIPFKVLDAPELQDDFYLNLVDWSAGNLLSVGLGACVYLWSACTSQVTRLCDLSVDGDSVTSVCWNERGSLVAVGTHKGFVQIWDAAGGRKLTSLEGHSARVGALAWNGEQLSSGSRDRVILQRDVRTPPAAERRLQGHRQEVCGLKWSPDHQHLASGGNDNKLLVWNSSSLVPVQQYSEHLAAVKAIAWSPHQHGLLASGGGTADRCLRFWNTLTGQALQSTDTGSQVCNLAWSKHANELVSTHGYSQNQILVWKYPSLTQVAKLTGHSYRVLYLAVSPDGEAIVTGAGDETLRFWNVFSKTRCTKESKSVLNLFTRIR
ncbi:fizzy-related protein homolog isoform X1 [Ictalurus punctatus]|uniref:Fizzy-related protein homolog n=1 Tax=Ictalurus punctatus TaxID=7998 RepID=A0A9F7RL70_ICTPU|nr:fizzy-related protein homolog isoform X1 [Ictalurus punctatus]